MGHKVSKELLDRWQERKAMIMASSFSHVESAESQKRRIERAQKDYIYFVENYFPHLVKSPCGKFQKQAANYIRDHKNGRAVFEWARGHAKSTHLSLLIPLWLKIQPLREINTMVLVSKSQESATMLLSDLQVELECNELFKRDFGNQIKAGDWADGRFQTADGCLFIALGRGQSPRGIKNRGNRPDYIGIDDIDDDEIVRNDKRVSQAFDWCLTALLGAMDMGRGRFVLVGNRIGKNSILSRMAERPRFFHTVVNALDGKGNPTWCSKYTIEEINSIKETMGERRFQKEYMNNPITEGAVFQSKHIRFGKMLPLKEYRSLVCYTDPSFKDSATSDYKATMLMGKTKEGAFHLLKAYAEQTSVTRMVAWHYELHDWIDGLVSVRYYMESNFIQQLLLDEFRKEGEACGMHIPVMGDSRKKPDKFARIEAMQPLFERGLVVLNEKEEKSVGMQQLIEQLQLFERGSRAHDDAPDALEGAIYLLNKRNISAQSRFVCGTRESRKY